MVDKRCPMGEFFFWDAMISSEGDYKCKALGKEISDQYDGMSYPICSCDNYQTCQRYLKAKPSLSREMGCC
jgi:hypothetical protein